MHILIDLIIRVLKLNMESIFNVVKGFEVPIDYTKRTTLRVVIECVINPLFKDFDYANMF